MKKLTVLFFFILLYDLSFAESKLGLLAGVSNSTFFQKDIVAGKDYVIIKMPYSDYGIHAGGFLNIKMGLFYLQPELYVSSISNTYKISNPDPFAAAKNVYKNDRNFNLEFPVLLGIKAGPARFMLGPSGRLVLFNLNELKDYTGYDVQLNKALWSFQTGAGLELGNFQLDLKYEFGITKIANGIKVDGTQRSFDYRANQIIVSIGWAFE